MRFILSSLLTLILTLSASFVFGQGKIAYANGDLILRIHPDVAKAEGEVRAVSKQLNKGVDTRARYISQKLKEYEGLIKGGKSPGELQEMEDSILDLEDELKEYQEMAEDSLDRFRDRVYASTLDKIDAAMEKVSKANGVECVFSTVNSSNVSMILYGPDESDMTLDILDELKCPLPDGMEDYVDYKSYEGDLRVGYTNIEWIISNLPQSRAIQNQINQTQSKQNEIIKVKREYLQLKYSDYLNHAKLEDLPEEDFKAKESELLKLDKEITTLIKKHETKIINLQNDLLTPLMEELEHVIDSIANTHGFTFILNQTTSSGVSTILYGPDEGDVTAAVIQAFGMDPKNGNIPVAPKNSRLGFVNIEYIVSKLPITDSLERNLEAIQLKMFKKHKVKEDYLGQLEAELRAKTITREASEEELEELEKSISSLEEEINQNLDRMEMEYMKERGKLYGPLMNKIQKIIDDFAQTEGYTYIINKTTGANILYLGENQDLSEKIIKKMKK